MVIDRFNWFLLSLILDLVVNGDLDNYKPRSDALLSARLIGSEKNISAYLGKKMYYLIFFFLFKRGKKKG